MPRIRRRGGGPAWAGRCASGTACWRRRWRSAATGTARRYGCAPRPDAGRNGSSIRPRGSSTCWPASTATGSRAVSRCRARHTSSGRSTSTRRSEPGRWPEAIPRVPPGRQFELLAGSTAIVEFLNWVGLMVQEVVEGVAEPTRANRIACATCAAAHLTRALGAAQVLGPGALAGVYRDLGHWVARLRGRNGRHHGFAAGSNGPGQPAGAGADHAAPRGARSGQSQERRPAPVGGTSTSARRRSPPSACHSAGPSAPCSAEPLTGLPERASALPAVADGAYRSARRMARLIP